MAVKPTPWWQSAIQFTLGIGLVAVVGLIALKAWPRPEPPVGWQVIRPPEDVMTLAEYDGAIWAGGRDGLLVIERAAGEVLREVAFDEELAYVTCLLVSDSGQTLWIGHLNGLTRLDRGSWRTFTTADGLPHNQILALGYDQEGDLWIGTAQGVSRYANGEFRPAPGGSHLGSNPVSVIFSDSVGRLWFGNGYSTTGGLVMFDGLRWQAFSTEDGLAHNMVNAILEDQHGVLWFGTGFASLGGASLYDDDSWRALSVEDGLAGAKVRSLFLDAANTLWVGSEYDGVAAQSGGSWIIYTPKQGLAGWEVKVMLQDSQNNFWLGTENGLTRIESAVWRTLEKVE